MPLAEILVHPRAAGKVPSHPSGLGEDRYHQLPQVVSARAGDATVLMDRKRGTYFTLNEVGGRVWELVCEGATGAEVVERLLGEYDVPTPQLEQDVTTTLRRLIDDRLLAQGVAAAPMVVEPRSQPMTKAVMSAGDLKVPSVVWCGLLIAWFKGLLRIRGFLGTLEWIWDRVEALPATAEAELETVKAVERVVAMAGAFYPGRAKCLEQSLTLYYVLRRQGVSVRHCQGVQFHPFQAHAWIEYGGEVINDVAEHVRHFARLPDQLP